MAVVVVCAFYFTDLYAVDSARSARERLLGLMKAFGVVCLLIGVASALVPALEFERFHLAEVVAVGGVVFVWHHGFARGLKNGPILSKVLIVGTEPIGRIVAEQLYLRKHLRMQVVGFIGDRYDSITLNCGNPRRLFLCVFPRHEIVNLVESKRVERILVTGPESCADFPAQDLMTLRLHGIPVEDCHSFCEHVLSQIPIANLSPAWVALADGFSRSFWIRFAKRAIDLLIALPCLVLSAPVFLLAAIAIKLDSAGPVFYSQERAGLNEHPFTLYKFRSMINNAEAESGPVWAGTDDPRVTRVGKILRTFRIDELPQLLNVLKGEMSLVGPRPERPFFISRFNEHVPYYYLRFAVKPGITGWAQISYPYAATDEDAVQKLQYELYYVKNNSPLFDLQILLLTLKVILLGRGSQ
jgi:sugar transferase (PEP-CTERM system associated)